jgi:hypothetical protein
MSQSKAAIVIVLDLDTREIIEDLRGLVPLSTFIREEIIKPYIKKKKSTPFDS